MPEFLRILNEAEFFAPIGYQKHLDNISTAYVRILQRARLAGMIDDFSDDEFEAIVHMLMGARGYPAGAIPMPAARSPRFRTTSFRLTGS